MATESRRTDPPLAQEVFDEPYSFEFFQAVRLLERMYPDRDPVGRDTDAKREVVRFRTRQTLSFPPCEIYDLVQDSVDAQQPPEMTVAFMGITGPVGILPYQYMELVMERARYKDTALWSFLDIFNHRMISLFYRVWEKYHFPIAYERNGADQFTSHLFGLIGMGTSGLRGQLSFRDQGLLPYSGLVVQRPHSATAMAGVIADYFDVPAEVVQFPGEWLKLDDNVTRLGSENSELGTSTIAGTRVWSDQSKFRIRLGAMSLKKFRAFIPVGSAHQPLSEFARLFTGLEFEFDMQLVLDAKEVPFAMLSGNVDDGPRLGWTSWLKTCEFANDDDQVVIRANN
ncbi:MAG TPA: type VI secretion system baseplate subunit TssG [Blastocatellia bacterium]|jgi:type VI secretion system protein ImpH|nr:type VI secretion system baseplate subunit TssG [Blastocatellia bacterium]